MADEGARKRRLAGAERPVEQDHVAPPGEVGDGGGQRLGFCQGLDDGRQ